MHNNDLRSMGEVLITDEEASSLTQGSSMWPMLRQQKDVVTVKRVDRILKKGDVVLYPDNSGRFILHRIIRIKNDIFIIRGDNNDFTEKVEKDKIVGVLKEFYRNGKHYDCEKSITYKLYVFWIRISYPLRYIFLYRFVYRILPLLSKIKHRIIKQA